MSTGAGWSSATLRPEDAAFSDHRHRHRHVTVVVTCTVVSTDVVDRESIVNKSTSPPMARAQPSNLRENPRACVVVRAKSGVQRIFAEAAEANRCFAAPSDNVAWTVSLPDNYFLSSYMIADSRAAGAAPTGNEKSGRNRRVIYRRAAGARLDIITSFSLSLLIKRTEKKTVVQLSGTATPDAGLCAEQQRRLAEHRRQAPMHARAPLHKVGADELGRCWHK